MLLQTDPPSEHDPSESGVGPRGHRLGHYLANEGGSRLDFQVWLLAASALVLLGGLSWGLRVLLRQFLTL